VKPVQKVLDDADLKKEDVDEIVLVGGSTRILKIQQLVRDSFNGKVHKHCVFPLVVFVLFFNCCSEISHIIHFFTIAHNQLLFHYFQIFYIYMNIVGIFVSSS